MVLDEHYEIVRSVTDVGRIMVTTIGGRSYFVDRDSLIEREPGSDVDVLRGLYAHPDDFYAAVASLHGYTIEANTLRHFTGRTFSSGKHLPLLFDTLTELRRAVDDGPHPSDEAYHAHRYSLGIRRPFVALEEARRLQDFIGTDAAPDFDRQGNS